MKKLKIRELREKVEDLCEENGWELTTFDVRYSGSDKILEFQFMRK